MAAADSGTLGELWSAAVIEQAASDWLPVNLRMGLLMGLDARPSREWLFYAIRRECMAP